jgi:hypothetical protein
MDVSRLAAHVESPKPELRSPDKVLVTAALAGPLVWLSQLTVAFALVGPLCQWQQRWPLHVTTAVALALVVAAVVVCWRRARTPGTSDPARRLATAGAALGTFFAVLVVALELPVVLLHPCL